MNIKGKAVAALIAFGMLMGFSVCANGAAEIPKDILKMKPFVSTAKMGFATKNEVTMSRNAAAKVQGLRNAGYIAVGDWQYDSKANVKTLKPDADTDGLKSVKLPNEWGKDNVGIFRTKFTMPETVNGFPVSGSAVSLVFEGDSTIDIYIDGKKVKSLKEKGELDIAGKIKPGESVTLGVKVTNMIQKGRLGSVVLHMASLDALSKPADDILSLLENARLLFDQMPVRDKTLFAAVTDANRALDALKGASDVAKVLSGLENTKKLLAPVQVLSEKYPVYNAGPYLQAVTQNEITIAWETRVPTPSVVYWGKGGLTEVVSDPKPVLNHKLTIKGLTPQTEYKYMAVSNKLAAPESTFRTAVKKDTPFKFVVWSDDQSNPQIFEPLVDLMIKQKPDVGFSTGDEVGCGGDYPQWAREFFYPLRRMIINTPFFVAIGNHEYCNIGCGNPVPAFENYMAVPNKPGYYQAVTYGSARFILLNQQENCAGVVPGTAQFEWLLKELESPEFKAAKFRFMLMHKPPYSQCWAGGYYDGESPVRMHIVPLIEKYGIDIVFSGHTHDYERGQWPRPGGPYYIITGGAGGGLDDTKYKDWPQMQMYKFVHHFSFASIEGNKLKFTAIDDTGKPIDTFEIVK